jgi:FkbM family methyltransferase
MRHDKKIIFKLESLICDLLGKSLPLGVVESIKNLSWILRLNSESRILYDKYSLFVDKGAVVFDIGANRGNHSSVFLKLGAKRVVMLEPNPDLILRLKNRFRGKSVVIINKGVSSMRSKLSFNVFEDIGHSSFLVGSDKEKLVKKIFVSTVTLFDLIKGYGKPNFIKIDVEGFEWEVIKTLKDPIEGLVFENSNLENTKKIISHLKSLGNYVFSTDSLLSRDSWVSYESFKDNLDSYFADINVFAKLVL